MALTLRPKPVTPVAMAPKVNAPAESWWVCPDAEFSARLQSRLEAMRASRELPAYAPEAPRPKLTQERTR